MTDHELMQAIYNNTLELKERVTAIEERLTVVEDRLTAVEERLEVMEKRLTAVEERLEVVENRLTAVGEGLALIEARLIIVEEKVTVLEERFSVVENKVTYINLMLENEIRINIRLVAEGHLDLARNLHEVLKVESEKEMTAVRMNILETEMCRMKERIADIA